MLLKIMFYGGKEKIVVFKYENSGLEKKQPQGHNFLVTFLSNLRNVLIEI